MTVELIEGDCREVLREFEVNSIDAVVTDPPYALTSGKKGGSGPASLNLKSPAGRSRVTTGFMGKAWDTGEVAFDPAFWQEVLRVLKPGGHVLAFGGSRTYHKIATAIDDAGFEIRDQIMWLYGSGFPKSSNQDGDWAGWGTALKPAHEPIVMARKPLIGTMEKNLAAHGVGALNIDGCRVETESRPLHIGDYKKTADNVYEGRQDGSLMGGSKVVGETDLGRWPANIIHDGSDEVLAAFPQARGAIAGTPTREIEPNVAFGRSHQSGGVEPRDQGGSAARFFYCAKASKADRDVGIKTAAKPVVTFATANGTSGKPSSISEGRNTEYRNTHPTVKPTALMRYLCRLVTPPGGTVLDPFMGSGSTGRGAVLEGFSFVGIEMMPEYFELADARIAAAEAEIAPKMQAAE